MKWINIEYSRMEADQRKSVCVCVFVVVLYHSVKCTCHQDCGPKHLKAIVIKPLKGAQQHLGHRVRLRLT